MHDRQRRLVLLTQYLVSHPGEQAGLADLARRLGVAKSTLSEDLLLVRQVLEEAGQGQVATQLGAQGGVTFRPEPDRERIGRAVAEWITRLNSPDRLTPEGFLYMTDLLFTPRLVDPMGELLAARFQDREVGLVATVETKGIPLALATARALGRPALLLRRDNRLSEGSSLSLNYFSGSSHRIQSMSLARRSPVRGQRVLFVDDFLKAGGTARAAADLLGEFDARVVGVGVLVATPDPARKLIPEYWACLEWREGAEEPPPWVRETPWVRSWLEAGSGTEA
ncbi:transcriptional regulator of the purine biosynthesis operon (PurR-pRpp) [Candidatus Hydrogenisulfobacillus filiaventi]|uniref:Transcriptional regulator of the purine biosynthesis operon (PurR-pRpp) n=1 Tax=Candidatus Hydrogenisulfobacillus filiaventi TaxID=2707344 RepID=A0A6F8ZJR5_9FIRM|nr:pur operon repressor [Bacillota bacterium]CAB1130121.1 transcriptional regulator of the purine biosynthesis operon (PurR-pRpp) [Candidatus Hydrogenisulfobacillus filiaventi]